MSASFVSAASGGGTTTASAPAQPSLYTPIYTGDNVYVRANGQLIGLVQTLTIARSVGRRGVNQVGTPLIVDAPTGAASVTVSLTNLYPILASLGLRAIGIAPNGSLVNQVNATPFDWSVHDEFSSGSPAIWTVTNCLWTQDSLQTPQTAQLTYTISYIGQDAIAHQ